jgi:hypothetical protein
MGTGHTTGDQVRVRRSALKRSEWLVRAVVVFCLLYALVAAVTRTDERFPLFGWSLFSQVPSAHGSDYSVRLVELDGRRLKPPKYYEDAKLVDQGRLVQATRAMTALGRAAERDPNGDVVTYRAGVFEGVYLNEYKRGRFEVVKRTYDIRDRFDCRCFVSETVLGEYDFR